MNRRRFLQLLMGSVAGGAVVFSNSEERRQAASLANSNEPMTVAKIQEAEKMLDTFDAQAEFQRAIGRAMATKIDREIMNGVVASMGV